MLGKGKGITYWSDLFTPETCGGFASSDRTISGFRESQRAMADKFICYMVRMSRWIGVLEVKKGPFIDKTPIFVPDDDPFVVRFKVLSKSFRVPLPFFAVLCGK